MQRRIVLLGVVTGFAFFLIGSTAKAHPDRGHHHERSEHDHKQGSHDHGDSDEPPRSSDSATPTIDSIPVKAAGPMTIDRRISLYGTIQPDRNRLAHIAPRFPGIVRNVFANTGDQVSADETLAEVEANESLRKYEVKSLISGTVLDRHAVKGEFVDSSEPLFTVADLSKVWAEFSLFPADYGLVNVGQPMTVSPGAGAGPHHAAVIYISPVADARTQSRTVRAELENSSRGLHPGLFATAEITVERRNVTVAVELSAIQSIDDQTVVFVKSQQGFSPRPVTLGISDSHSVEILAGLQVGEIYASDESFILKADTLKSEAGHDHHH